jgi:uncharacterized protein (UPF0332 family)
MSAEEFITYRLNKAEEVYAAAVLLYNAGQWNSAVNRLYYACFYAASALLLKRGIGAKTHAGVISKFSESVVRTHEMSADEYKVYSKLLNWRTKGDYSDMFDFCKEDLDDVMEPTRVFLDGVKKLIAES